MPHKREPYSNSSETQVYFGFVFKRGESAFNFAKSVIGREFAVDIAYVPERARYEVVVRRRMVLLHQDIEILLADLSERAERFGGQQDGWGKADADA